MAKTSDRGETNEGDAYGGPLWRHRIGGEAVTDVVHFCAGRDIQARPPADEVLIPYDVWTNQAHAVMLGAQGIISVDEMQSLLTGLRAIERDCFDEKFHLNPDLEDVHGNIEAALATHCGAETAGKIHTGRSRNDQAACTMRLYLRAQLLFAAGEMIQLGQALCRKADEHYDTLMPGFTHRQHGTVSSFAHLLLSHAQAVARDLERVHALLPLLNANPLGAAAGYGTSWDLDRELTRILLAFDEIQANALDAVSTRWEPEAQAVSLLSLYMNHAATLANDLIFLSTSEAGMIRLADGYVTGSSIMPQKRNPDVGEVIQAKAAMVHGYLQSLLSIPRAGLSGYNREYQYTKYAVMDAFDEVEDVGAVLAGAVETLTINKRRMAEACREGYLFAVDLADLLVRARGLSFRQAHSLVGGAIARVEREEDFTRDAFNAMLKAEKIKQLTKAEWNEATDPKKALEARKHWGGPAPDTSRDLQEYLLDQFATYSAEVNALQIDIIEARDFIARVETEGLGALEELEDLGEE